MDRADQKSLPILSAPGAENKRKAGESAGTVVTHCRSADSPPQSAAKIPTAKRSPAAAAGPTGASFWSRFKSELLTGKEHNKVFQSWLKDLCLAEGAHSKEIQLTLQIPSSLHKKWAAENILPLLQNRAGRHYGKPCQIGFQILRKSVAASAVAVAAPVSAPSGESFRANRIAENKRRATGFAGIRPAPACNGGAESARPTLFESAGVSAADSAKSSFSAALPVSLPQRAGGSFGKEASPPEIGLSESPPPPRGCLSRSRSRSKTAFFHPDYLFDNFVVGKNNEFAREVCFCLTQRRSIAFNPVFVYGPSGVGKTHLLNALGWEFAAGFPEKRIHYLSAEKFLNECIHSIQKREMKRFQKKYRSRCDLLLLDDIQMIARGTAVQEEFFHTFNELFNRGAPVVVCCDSPPSRVPGLEDRLRSRMEGGLVAEISYPDWETRVAILKSKAERKRLELPDKILFQIARNHRRSIREMEGALNKIKMLSDLKGGPLSPDYIQSLLEKAAPRPITALEIQKKAAKKFHVSLEEALSLSRKKDALLARQTAMYFIKTKLRKSLSDTGRLFGGKDHSTVVNGLKKIERLKAKDPEFRLALDELEREMESCGAV